jgi:hypothetical protein
LVGCTTGSREEVPGERKPVIKRLMMMMMMMMMMMISAFAIKKKYSYSATFHSNTPA